MPMSPPALIFRFGRSVPKKTVNLLIGLADLGIIHRGSGADNIRNITASPTAGIDPES